MPPLAVTLAVPSLPPKQLTGVEVHEAETDDEGSVTIASQVAVHPFASVTVTVYVPAVNPLIEEVVAALLHK